MRFNQPLTPLLLSAGAIAALASFLLFGLQPLVVGTIGYWHHPSTVVQFFQWTYLVGVALTGLTSGLQPRADMRVATAIFVPVAAYTLLAVVPAGPRRLGDLAPLAVWLACASTVLVRSLAKSPAMAPHRPYAILASSNAGALLGVVIWLHPLHSASSTSWEIVGLLLLAIGIGLVLVLCNLGTQPPRTQTASNGTGSAPMHHMAIWFGLATLASLAMMLAHIVFVTADESGVSTDSLRVPGTALPLLLFLLAYMVGWFPIGNARFKLGDRWVGHLIAIGLILAWTMASYQSKTVLSVALYVFCAGCVETLRRFAPHPTGATAFQVVQAAGGACGGWLSLYVS